MSSAHAATDRTDGVVVVDGTAKPSADIPFYAARNGHVVIDGHAQRPVLAEDVGPLEVPEEDREAVRPDPKTRIDTITADLRRAADEDETARRLQAMPGIGPVTASVPAATLPDVSVFRSARDLSAWLGLTPKPHSSGGKERLGAISKMGNRYIRRLLYLGAMGVISARKRSDPGDDRPGRMLGKKPLKVVAIALANRMARAVRAMLRSGEAWRAA